MMCLSNVHMLQCLKQLSMFTLKDFQNIFFFFRVPLCRKENKQVDCFFSLLSSPPFSFFLPFFSLSLSVLIFLSFPFSFLLFSFFLSLCKILQNNSSNYSSKARNASRLTLHSPFNSCQVFTCIYQK